MTTTASKWSKVKPWLGLAAVFVTGAILGSLLTVKIATNRLHRLAAGGAPEMRALIVERLDHELGLKPEQKTEIDKIIESRQEKIKSLRAQIAPQIAQNLMEGQKEIEATLNPEQKAAFVAWATEQRQRFNRLL